MKSNRLFDRVLAASVQGIRANPKMRSVTPETLARYANEDARAVLDYAREPELSPLITANLVPMAVLLSGARPLRGQANCRPAA